MTQRKDGVYMNSEEIIFQQYKLYTEQKDNFIDRSFTTNKFYLIVVLLLNLGLFLLKDFGPLYNISPVLIFSVAGMAVSILWWFNVDAYNFLLKVKFSKVIDEIEKKLPVQPYTYEFEGIKEWKKRRRMFLFADVQKVFVLFAFLLFLIISIHATVDLFV